MTDIYPSTPTQLASFFEEPSGFSTRAVHAGDERPKHAHALVEPIFQTSTYTFENMAEVTRYQQDRALGLEHTRCEYGRYGNPTIQACEAQLAALEGAEDAVQVASGMAAITSTLFNLLSAGSHMVLTGDCYHRTRQFCEKFLPRFGVSYTVVPCGDYAALEDAIRPETRVLLSETPTNPFLRVLDVERFAQIARRHSLVSVVDATFATPANLRPLEWGVDLVVHSASKYLAGHHDLLAGFVAGSKELTQPIRAGVGVLGGISDPNTAFLLSRGMKTLAMRVSQHNRNGQAAAEFLESHPAVERVWYPGLESHPEHALAVRQMSGFGGVVSFALRGDRARVYRFIDSLRLASISSSLGGPETLITHPASMAYASAAPEERTRLGITDGLVRMAFGFEDTKDLLADLNQALEC
jgi:cystathionine gamma-synthase